MVWLIKMQTSTKSNLSDTATRCCLMIYSLFQLSLPMNRFYSKSLSVHWIILGQYWMIPLYVEDKSILIMSTQDGVFDTKYCRHKISVRKEHAVIMTKKITKLWKNKMLRSLERNKLLKMVKC